MIQENKPHCGKTNLRRRLINQSIRNIHFFMQNPNYFDFIPSFVNLAEYNMGFNF